MSSLFYLAMKIALKRKIALCVIILNIKRKKKPSVWVREWILKREDVGAYNQLLPECNIENPAQFSNFL